MERITVRLRLSLTIFVAVMVIGTVGIMHLEKRSLLDALYFSIVTVATVGYGDIHPVTPAGKLLVMVMIVGGVGTFLGVIASIAEIFLSRREQQIRLKKLNMIIGLFFSETGTCLLQIFARADSELDAVRAHLLVRGDWKDRHYQEATARLRDHPFRVDSNAIDLALLRKSLETSGNFVVRLLENPYLTEHEAFTDILIALLHLKEELESRDALTGLPPTDLDHLSGDIKRAYSHLAKVWLSYVQHLQANYPFLFSLAMRRNPFDRQATVVISY